MTTWLPKVGKPIREGYKKMKKFVIFLFLLINIFLFAEEPVFILKKDLVLEDVYLNEKRFGS